MIDRRRMRARWLIATLLVLLLALVGVQGSFTQDYGHQYALGDIPLDPATYQKHLKVWPEDMAAEALPMAYDARAAGLVTAAKNQGSCGSCWAFASVGAMESHLLKEFGFGPTDLSEQQLVSCNTSMSGCCGGSSSAPRFWENTGPVYEGCFPYGDGGTSCPTQSAVACNNSNGCDQLDYRVIDWHTVGTTANDFKTSLYLYGPSYWRYDVYSDFYTYWNGGAGEVYVNQGGSYQGGHAVLLIGWDDTKGAYLLKNSWGGSGGPFSDGTFWVAYAGHARNLRFGMSNFSLTSLGCSSHQECDDGLYCNGAEACVDNVCQDGIPPSCSDDGLFCNGTGMCDEIADECVQSGSPCAESTICNEKTDHCDLVACFSNGDCDDGQACTADMCVNPGSAAAACDNAWPACGAADGCCGPDCSGADDPDCTCGNGTCEGAASGEDCYSCPTDCISGQGGGSCNACFKGVCDGICHPVKEGPECTDCAPSYCCGDGVCEGAEDSLNCSVDCGAPPACGNGTCDPDESPCNCAADCGAPPSTETDCSNRVDDDCDGLTDCGDSDCHEDPTCECLPDGAACTDNAECCSQKCAGKKCR